MELSFLLSTIASMNEVLEAFYIGEKPGIDGSSILLVFDETLEFQHMDIITNGATNLLVEDFNRGWCKCRCIIFDKESYLEEKLFSPGTKFLKMGSSYEE